MDEIFVNVVAILVTLIPVFFCYITGTLVERKHLRSIKRREKAMLGLPHVSFEKHILDGRRVQEARLVTGEVVVAADLFKYYLSWIKAFFGGRLTAYEPVLDRARREAVLRMKKRAQGSDLIINTKLDTVMLNSPAISRRSSIRPRAAVFAYGTAITFEKS